MASDPYRLTFDGFDDEVVTGYTQTAVSDYSVEAWIQTASSDLADQIPTQVLFQDRGPPGSGGVSLTLALAQGEPVFLLDLDGTFYGVQSQRQVNDGQWHHVVGTFSQTGPFVDPSDFAVYVDGVAVSTTAQQQGGSSPPFTGSGPAEIGRHENWNTWYQGSVGQVVVFTRALPASEVLSRCTIRASTYGRALCGSTADSLPDGGGVNAFPILAPGNQLLDIQFGQSAPGLATTVGEGVVGSSLADLWNAGGSAGEPSVYTLSNLVDADGSPSPISLTATNLGGQWGLTVDAGFMTNWSYSFSGASASLELDGVPDGVYDLYLYANVQPSPPGSGTVLNSAFQVSVLDPQGSTLSLTPQLSTTPNSSPALPSFEEGGQYVVFRGLSSRSGTRLFVNVANGAQGTGNDGCEINALQLVRTAAVGNAGWALHDSLANAGDRVTLEGLFGSGPVVHFPGGIAESPDAGELNGAVERLTLTVPSGATSGPVYVTSQLGISPPLNLEVAGYTIGLQPFQHDYSQAMYARAATDYPVPTNEGVPVVDDQYVWFVGGGNYQGELVTSTQGALRNADDTLGTVVPAVNQIPDNLGNSAAVRVGNYLYAVGGNGAAGSQATVYQAALQSDGSPGPWSTTFPLNQARQGHAAIVLGNRLYVIGGINNPSNPVGVEFAPINPDGTLQPFQLAGVGLTVPRYYLGIIATPSQLYVVGGEDGSGGFYPRDTIESATLDADGTLEPFSASGATLSEPRAFFQSAVAGRHLFLVGGYNGSQMAEIDEAVVDNATGLLGGFALNPVQLPSGTNLAPVFRVGGTLYEMGAGDLGDPSGNTLSQHASLNASGAIGAFSASSVSTLVTASRTGAGAVIGNTFWLFGGQQDQAQGFAILDTIQSSTIDPTGALGPFSQSSNTLVDQRGNTIAAVIGSNVYLVGDYGFGLPSNSLEQARIYPDGGLGSFTQYSQSLVENLSAEGLAVDQGQLYVFGGNNGSALSHVEAAAVLLDGGLGPFSIVGSMSNGVSAPGVVVVGTAIDALSGNGSSFTNQVQTLSGLSPDGGASFTVASGVTLESADAQAMTAVVGSNVLVLSGYGSSSYPTAIEQASIASGSLSSFVGGGALPYNINSGTALVAHNTLSIIGGDQSPQENLQSGVLQAPLQ